MSPESLFARSQGKMEKESQFYKVVPRHIVWYMRTLINDQNHNKIKKEVLRQYLKPPVSLN